jgi:hypothetical protein
VLKIVKPSNISYLRCTFGTYRTHPILTSAQHRQHEHETGDAIPLPWPVETSFLEVTCLDPGTVAGFPVDDCTAPSLDLGIREAAENEKATFYFFFYFFIFLFFGDSVSQSRSKRGLRNTRADSGNEL